MLQGKKCVGLHLLNLFMIKKHYRKTPFCPRHGAKWGSGGKQKIRIIEPLIFSSLYNSFVKSDYSSHISQVNSVFLLFFSSPAQE